MRLSDIRKQLTKNGYLPNDEIVMAAYGALHGVPLLVESDPGQGKTSLALAMGQAFGLSVLRVQFYEGIDCGQDTVRLQLPKTATFHPGNTEYFSEKFRWEDD